MRQEVIETGKSVEDAIHAACAKLGCAREDCEWEILDLPKRSLFGLKSSPAKVKVGIEIPDPVPAHQAAAPMKAAASAPERRPQPKREPRPAPLRQERQNYPEKADAPLSAPPSQEMKTKADLAGEYLLTLLKEIGLPQTELQYVWDEGGVCLRIEGEGLGLVIGRRGDTLDALQYLCALVANRRDGEYLRVTVDCGDYRLKRKSSLESLAHRLCAQVIKTESSKTLEPMNPFERRIIHATVSSIEGVSSASIGEEPNRRVIITCPGAKGGKRPSASRERDQGGDRAPRSRTPIADRPSWPDEGAKGDRPDEHGTGPARRSAPPRGRNDRDRRSGGGRGERRERTPAYQPAKEKPDNPPTEADNKPLYGKIDLE